MTASLPPSKTASDALALGGWLVAGRDAVQQRGVDANALLREVGLDLSQADDPMARYPARLGLAFWEKALAATGDELLGMDVALQFLPLSISALGYALMASDNLAEMYLRLARYAHVVTDAADVRFHQEAGFGRLSITGDQALLGTAEPATVWSIFDYAMLTLVRGSRMLFGRGFTPLELRLQRQRPKDHAKFEKVFRCVPVYGCEDNALVVDRATLHKPLSFANLEVVKASEDAMDRYRSNWADRGLAAQLAALLKDMLPSGEPRQEEVAQRLSMNLRTLQRRLAEQQTCYRDVLNQTRHQLALDHLRSTRYSVGEISFLLGFSEVSAFTRAFRRWTGTSPSTWRQSAPPA